MPFASLLRLSFSSLFLQLPRVLSLDGTKKTVARVFLCPLRAALAPFPFHEPKREREPSFRHRWHRLHDWSVRALRSCGSSTINVSMATKERSCGSLFFPLPLHFSLSFSFFLSPSLTLFHFLQMQFFYQMYIYIKENVKKRCENQLETEAKQRRE